MTDHRRRRITKAHRICRNRTRQLHKRLRRALNHPISPARPCRCDESTIQAVGCICRNPHPSPGPSDPTYSRLSGWEQHLTSVLDDLRELATDTAGIVHTATGRRQPPIPPRPPVTGQRPTSTGNRTGPRAWTDHTCARITAALDDIRDAWIRGWRGDADIGEDQLDLIVSSVHDIADRLAGLRNRLDEWGDHDDTSGGAVECGCDGCPSCSDENRDCTRMAKYRGKELCAACYQRQQRAS